MITLKIVKGPSKGKLFESDSDLVTIGRSKLNSLPIANSFVSSRHGEIVRSKKKYVYRDLESVNGTLIRRGNEEILIGQGHETELALANGDQIVIGAVPNLVVLEFSVARRGAQRDGKYGKETENSERDKDWPDRTTVVSTVEIGEINRVSNHLRRDHDALQILYHFSLGLQSAIVKRERLIRAVGNLIFKLFPKAQHLMLLESRADGSGFAPILAKAREGEDGPPPMSFSVVERIQEEGVAILIEDVRRELDPAQSLLQAGVRSVVCAPLLCRGKLRCILQVTSTLMTGLFDQADLEILTVLAGQVAAALEKAELLENLRAAEAKLRVENEKLEQRVAERTQDLEQALGNLLSTQAQLVQSEKMASLGLLVAGVAHELNNSISFIYSNIDPLRAHIGKTTAALESYESLLCSDPAGRTVVETLRAGTRLEGSLGTIEKLLRLIREGGVRSKEIVADLKTFSRVDEAELKTVDLHQGIDTTLNLLRNRLKNRITVHKVYGDIPEVTCFAGQMNQVFMNLLMNGADAIEMEGNLWITTSPRTRDGEDWVRIEVRDDGCGVEEAILPKIFDPFFTTKKVGGGTGLGLSISFSIVERHGGTIEVRSRSGEGTTFTVEIPVDPGGKASLRERGYGNKRN